MAHPLIDRFNSIKYRNIIAAGKYISLLNLIYYSELSGLIDLAMHCDHEVAPDLEVSYECEIIYKPGSYFRTDFLEIKGIKSNRALEGFINIDVLFQKITGSGIFYMSKNLLTYGIDWAILNIEKLIEVEYTGN
jgi:hypothetical protein